MRISDWSSDVCSSDLRKGAGGAGAADRPHRQKSSPVDDASQHGGRDRIGGARKLGQIFRYVPSPKEGQAGEGDAPGATGRASCGGRVCQYGLNWEGAVTLKKKKQ